LILLVGVVGESDAPHFADHYAAVSDLRADLEALDRLVQIGLHRDLRLEQLAGAED